jgi:hypothetical protein
LASVMWDGEYSACDSPSQSRRDAAVGGHVWGGVVAN